jgi:hypothetical protein
LPSGVTSTRRITLPSSRMRREIEGTAASNF